jgi:hypothetical protein
MNISQGVLGSGHGRCATSTSPTERLMRNRSRSWPPSRSPCYCMTNGTNAIIEFSCTFLRTVCEISRPFWLVLRLTFVGTLSEARSPTPNFRIALEKAEKK